MHAAGDGSHTTRGARSSLLMPPRCGAFQCKHCVLRGSSDTAAALVVVAAAAAATAAENAARSGSALFVSFALAFAFVAFAFVQRGRGHGRSVDAAGASNFFCTGCGFSTQRARLLSVCVM